ncbi:hypothetical protein P43SY_007751 [Pythium insidiosum]|uniref:Uncharacterized protein n=1 Tax=Pythium insidiosum TaxID=114742 RepID=A0AAD5LCQ6_PYTIN|nr:hypothetical protein P43SY_007751 [Pythium insidiosum]
MLRVRARWLLPSRRRSAAAWRSLSTLPVEGDSLLRIGERVLRTGDPAEKVAITLRCQELWERGALRLHDGDAWRSDPPERPARSALPKLLPPKQMPSPKDMDAPIPVVMLHALAHIELGAIDNYWDTLVRFDPAKYALPKAFYDDFLGVASDEARHFAMVDARLRELGSFYGALPATTALLEHATNTASALAARLAVVPLVQEARGLDSGDRLVHRLRSVGDKASAAVVEQIVFEERGHVACGIKWFRHLCDNVLHVDAVAYFHELVLQFFPDGLPGPFDMEARLAANMEAAWYQPLEAKPRAFDNTPQAPVPSSASTRLAQFAASKKKVVLAGSVWPERTSSAAGVRSSDIIGVLQGAGFHVICVSPSRLNAHTEALERDHGVQCVQCDANSDALQSLLLETPPQLVIFDRFIAEEMYGWQVERYAPTALRVLDLQDVHFLRRAREVLVKKRGVPFAETLDLATLPLDRDVEKHVIRELASIHRSDLTLFVSDAERDVLTSRFQVAPELLHRCDFFYPCVPPPQALPAFDDRRDVAFIGSFKHAPNVDAVEWLARSIAPLLRGQQQSSRGSPEIHIYGSYSQDAKKYQRLHDPSRGVRLMGFAPDVHETLRQYRVTVAPLRFGAGIKGKIADSWFNGTPCVTTSIGAEGMRLDATPWGGRIEDDPLRFAQATLALYDSRDEWTTAQRHGQQAVEARYDGSRNGAALLERLERAQAEREKTREANWMGRILWSERFRATEFMSRYIRIKNEHERERRAPGAGQ